MNIKDVRKQWLCPKCGEYYSEVYYNRPNIEYLPAYKPYAYEERMKVTCTCCGYYFYTDIIGKEE